MTISGKATEKKEICPHRTFNIHAACVADLPECVQCPTRHSDKQRYGIDYTRKRKKGEKAKKTCAQRWKLAIFYGGLVVIVALVLGYFLPRMAHQQLHEELPPFDITDVLIGGMISLLTGLCFVSCCVCGGCCCKKGFEICILCKCFE